MTSAASASPSPCSQPVHKLNHSSVPTVFSGGAALTSWLPRARRGANQLALIDDQNEPGDAPADGSGAVDGVAIREVPLLMTDPDATADMVAAAIDLAGLEVPARTDR